LLVSRAPAPRLFRPCSSMPGVIAPQLLLCGKHRAAPEVLPRLAASWISKLFAGQLRGCRPLQQVGALLEPTAQRPVRRI